MKIIFAGIPLYCFAICFQTCCIRSSAVSTVTIGLLSRDRRVMMQRGSSNGTVTAWSLSAQSRIERTEAMEFLSFDTTKKIQRRMNSLPRSHPRERYLISLGTTCMVWSAVPSPVSDTAQLENWKYVSLTKAPFWRVQSQRVQDDVKMRVQASATVFVEYSYGSRDESRARTYVALLYT